MRIAQQSSRCGRAENTARRWGTALVVYVVVAIIGCVQPAGEPLTPEDRCEILCDGNRGTHPCTGEVPDENCVSSCASLISSLKDECLTCVLTASGWIGEACVCEEVDTFGNLNQTCKACEYTTHQTNCADGPNCTKDSATCDGFTMVAPSGTACAAICGS